MEEKEEHSLASLKAEFEDLQKRLMLAREDANMREISLRSVSMECQFLRSDVERLEHRLVAMEDDRDRWRNKCLKKNESE